MLLTNQSAKVVTLQVQRHVSGEYTMYAFEHTYGFGNVASCFVQSTRLH